MSALAGPRPLLASALSAAVLVPALVAGARTWIPRASVAAADFDALVLAAFSTGAYGEMVAVNLRYDQHLTFSIGQIAYQVAVFGRLLLGLYVARTLPLGNLGAVRPLLRKVLVAGALRGAIGSTIFTATAPAGVSGHPGLAFGRRFLIEAGQLGLTLAYAAAIALLFLSARWKPAVRALAPIGRMALTWYLLQTVFGVWVFYHFANGPALMGKLGAAPIVGLAVLGFALQLVLARLWLRRFRFGPAEWLWRSLTYGRVQPLRASLAAGLAATLLAIAPRAMAQEVDPGDAASESRIAVAGASLQARVIGRGQPLIVLHGGPDFDHAYLLPDLDRLKDAFHLIYYDQRGRGRSAEGVRPEDVTLSSEVDDLDKVRQHFRLETSAVLGHSWGAVLALEYALRHPTRVSHLVLMNPAPVSAADLAVLRKAYLEKLGPEHERQKEIMASAAYRAGEPQAVAARYRIHFKPALKRPPDYEKLMAAMKAQFVRQGAEGILKAWAVEERLYRDTWQVEGYDLGPKLKSLRIPALVITGTHDFIPVEIAAHIARALPRARFVALEDCGHFTYLECPAGVRHALDDFFGRAKAAAR